MDKITIKEFKSLSPVTRLGLPYIQFRHIQDDPVDTEIGDLTSSQGDIRPIMDFVEKHSVKLGRILDKDTNGTYRIGRVIITRDWNRPRHYNNVTIYMVT